MGVVLLTNRDTVDSLHNIDMFEGGWWRWALVGPDRVAVAG